MLCRIWRSRGGSYEEFCLLGYNAMYSIESQQMSRKNLSLPSSGSKNKLNKIPVWKQVINRVNRQICSSETSVKFQRTVQRYIPEDRKLFKYHIISVFLPSFLLFFFKYLCLSLYIHFLSTSLRRAKFNMPLKRGLCSKDESVIAIVTRFTCYTEHGP
jgi:hypothetical protein